MLVGRVAIGPLSPVQRSGEPQLARALPGAHMVVSNAEGQELKGVVTDDDGSFRVALHAGSFRIDMPDIAGGRSTKDLPATVAFVEGQETRLDIRQRHPLACKPAPDNFIILVAIRD